MKKFTALILSLFAIPILSNCEMRTYTVTWKDWDGKVLEVDENLHLGDVPTYDSDDPTREGSIISKYIFTGWDKEITPIEGANQVYTAHLDKVYDCDLYLKISIPEANEFEDVEIILGYYDGEVTSVDWGDGSTELTFDPPAHTYTEPGDYVIKIKGDISSVSISNVINKKDLVTHVVLGPKITEVGEDAFYGYSKLESIIFDEDVNIPSIGRYAFRECPLKQITLPSSITSIGDHAFYYCNQLESVDLSHCSSLTLIDSFAFWLCTKMASIRFPEQSKLDTIGDHAFYRCDALTSINLPDSVTTLCDFCFCYCKVLVSFNIPPKVTEIPYGAFDHCMKLKNVAIHEGITSIGGAAFSTCYRLSSVYIPSTVTSIGENAFSDCSDVTSIKVDPRNVNYTSRDNNGNEINMLIEKTTNTLLAGCNNSSGTIPEGIVKIASYAFSTHSCPDTVIIPKTVEEIGGYAFYGCAGMNSIVLEEGSNLRTIGGLAFYADKFTSFTFPASVETVGSAAFWRCRQLMDVDLTAFTIPDVNEIPQLESDGVFSECPAGCVFHVASGMKTIFESDPNWNNVPGEFVESE